MIKVLLSSTSPHKALSVQLAFKKVFPGERIYLSKHKASSNINEQPVGINEIFTGASNRINNSVRNINKKYDFVVGIENGLISTYLNEKEIWLDIAGVIIQDVEGNRSYSSSGGVEVPEEFVLEAERRSFVKHTYSSIMNEKIGTESTDPHFSITNYLVTRSSLLEQALIVALGQYLRVKK